MRIRGRRCAYGGGDAHDGVGDAHDGVGDAHAWSEMRIRPNFCAFLGGIQHLGQTPQKSDEKKVEI